jgi:uncharacterized protein
MRLVRDDSKVVCEHCVVAATPWRRFKGLLGRSSMHDGEGLWIQRSSSIHMFFMRFPIDVVFLDGNLQVRKVVRDLKPWRIAAARGAKSVVELPAGAAERLDVKPGDRLALDDA